jgi:histidinol-phosphatase (PHP family)
MIKSDFHIHTTISVDASGKIDDMVARAIEIGLTEIAITDHADYNPLDEGANLYKPREAYEQTVRAREKFGDRIIIRHGVELGEPHMFVEEIKEARKQPNDVIIGSVHFIGSHGVHADYFDAYPLEEGIRAFFEFTLELAKTADIDILAHLDYFDRYTTQRGYPAYRPEAHKGQIMPILETIIGRKIALEVNTSGYRSPANRCFPHPEVLKWYYELGGRRISIGSDSHKPEHMGCGFEQTEEVLRGIGFSEYHTFQGRKAEAKKFE